MCLITTESRGGLSKTRCRSSRGRARFLFRDLLVHATMILQSPGAPHIAHRDVWGSRQDPPSAKNAEGWGTMNSLVGARQRCGGLAGNQEKALAAGIGFEAVQASAGGGGSAGAEFGPPQ